VSAPLSPEDRAAIEFGLDCCIPWPYAKVVGTPARERVPLERGDTVIKITNLYGLYELGRTLQRLDSDLLNNPLFVDVKDLCLHSMRSLIYLTKDEIVPVKAVRESAECLIKSIKTMVNATEHQGYRPIPINPIYIVPIRDDLSRFQAALSEEIRQLPFYFVSPRGSLSIDHLVDGASVGYRTATLGLLDDFIRQEIDEAGRSLAFERATACGFHILRSVEIAIKGYLHAATGSLPKMNKRNWSEYITQLEAAGASADLIDLFRLLKAKRNPLMHPQDNLDIDEAINLFCISRAVTDALIDDIIAKKLETSFTASLAALPMI
jgi:hypothetical protein